MSVSTPTPHRSPSHALPASPPINQVYALDTAGGVAPSKPASAPAPSPPAPPAGGGGASIDGGGGTSGTGGDSPATGGIGGGGVFVIILVVLSVAAVTASFVFKNVKGRWPWVKGDSSNGDYSSMNDVGI